MLHWQSCQTPTAETRVRQNHSWLTLIWLLTDAETCVVSISSWNERTKSLVLLWRGHPFPLFRLCLCTNVTMVFSSSVKCSATGFEGHSSRVAQCTTQGKETVASCRGCLVSLLNGTKKGAKLRKPHPVILISGLLFTMSAAWPEKFFLGKWSSIFGCDMKLTTKGDLMGLCPKFWTAHWPGNLTRVRMCSFSARSPISTQDLMLPHKGQADVVVPHQIEKAQCCDKDQ